MTKAIMIQGTASNAGKSLITAGLCRILAQDGYSVAPFKSQNMALNSFITGEGLEMGRAQVVQAEAAGLEPSVLMNPVLLKPTSDRGSQVIVQGEVVGTMTAAEYFRYKVSLVPIIRKAYQALAQKHEIIVIEGAGSPAEINLKEQDIVNMGMARIARAPVLLVADIDRGGVFASLYGTVMLLEEDERKLIKGSVINKFRGDPEILKPGLTMIEAKTGIPVLGTVPYLAIDLEDEDSLADRFDREKTVRTVDIAVLKLPRLSNFTDFNVLELLPEVSLRYVRKTSEFGNPDLIIIPGTKNTMGDLLWLRQNGLEAEIQKFAARGAVIFGICGGYQMLGHTLEDPYGVEHGGTLAGMGLLDISTVFASAKTRTQVRGRFTRLEGILEGLSGIPFHGYEIHMGISPDSLALPLTLLEDLSGSAGKKADGGQKGNIFGSYVHGIFDDEGVAQALVRCFLKSKGIEETGVGPVNYRAYKDGQYNLLAEALRQTLDMDAIYTILEEGIGQDV
ncbi:adenosylcobyric acid synthase (glutamine-hydrolysing) [Syntrophobotulus glycolicus DSM 8271]|uniref:Cobyric acid synthase n=1 Tax=Syntrophobotulus glycolicus (strain DSM 8271 / FlGlyR) TaxID=645991 RepID=F0SZ31_SYNGF|nr:cobyric acid synthase [Syntrophobotulus glycolicus]ADY57149.1 adenosylcobyric acid synthase (glutamine-hydrolysing) [Syntrophobotulus glycolicus DSM 8271]